jgi:hypothetical protein
MKNLVPSRNKLLFLSCFLVSSFFTAISEFVSMVLPSQIVFLHGLESSARGKKFQYLKKLGVPVFAVDMPCGRGLRGVASDLPLVLSLGLFLFAVCILLSLVRRVVFFFFVVVSFPMPHAS